MSDDRITQKKNVAPPVMVAYVSLGSSPGVDRATFQPPEGWFVDAVLPAAASNGLGAIMVCRPLEAT